MSGDSIPHILLVDDDLRLRGLLETYFEARGIEGRGCGNLEQMERALRELPIDLMVLDLMLPGPGRSRYLPGLARGAEFFAHHHAHGQRR